MRPRIVSRLLRTLSDTVGFISELPHELVNAFHATLEEVWEADIIVHVRDASHEDSEAQKEDVFAVLNTLGLGESIENSLVEVLNKTDLLTDEAREVLANQAARAKTPVIPLSALTREGCPVLLDYLDTRLSAGADIIDVDLPPDDGAGLAWLYHHGDVLERHDAAEAIHLKVRLDTADAGRFAQRSKERPR